MTVINKLMDNRKFLLVISFPEWSRKTRVNNDTGNGVGRLRGQNEREKEEKEEKEEEGGKQILWLILDHQLYNSFYPF